MDLPAETQLRWILANTATLLELGAEPVRGLILPTGEFFPDRFDGSPRSVAALMARIQDHAGLADLKVDLTLVTPEGEAQTVSCSSGACGSGGKINTSLDRVARKDDGSYTVTLSTGEVRSPVVLTTTLVRAVATMFMTEADAFAGTLDAEREPLTDLAAVLLGFGVLMANGSYIYMKGCSGVQVHAATRMPVDEITLALGIFCRLHDVPERTASKHLELTPAEHFDESYAWASSNHAITKMLRKRPDAVRAGDYSLQPARSWLARVLGVGAKKRERTADEELAELERSMKAGAMVKKTVDPARAKKLAELRALVDESLEE
ncbi:MAG: hypothetical protein QM820_29355 [Minicystis sp.]